MITRRIFNLFSAFAAAPLVEWTHGSTHQAPPPGGQNVVDDFAVLVVDDLTNQVVNS